MMVELKVQDYEKNKMAYAEKERVLFSVLGDDVEINHVGSTAIPDMCGKNIIDILVGAKNQEEFLRFKEIIAGLGYFASQNSRTEIYQFFASRQGETGEGDSHIHLVIKNTERYNDFLTLRDYLLVNKKEAEDYSNHKKKLVEMGVVDRKEYRRVKSEYVSALIERARKFEK